MVVLDLIEPTQDIYIIGLSFGKLKNYLKKVRIYDDNTALKITNGLRSAYIETEGTLYILNKQQFNEYSKWINANYDDRTKRAISYVILDDYRGDIILKVFSELGKEVLKPDYDDKISLNRQVVFDKNDYWSEVVVDIHGTHRRKTMADKIWWK